MKCEYCGAEEALPFVCNYCGGVFCGDHRLPEAHACKGDLTQRRTVMPPPTTTFTWSDSAAAPQPQVSGSKVFSSIEVRDIVIAYLGLALAFFISFSGGAVNSDILTAHEAELLARLAVALLAVGPGFVLHELSHKFAARRYGHWAEFRMWPLGLLFALATSFLGFIFAAPGATYISGVGITKEQNGKISLAGPITNIVVAVVFLTLFFTGPYYVKPFGITGAYINIFLATFNLLPVMPLDGAKVFGWNKALWAAFFLPLAGVMVEFLHLFGAF